jgi:hypothetical protein
MNASGLSPSNIIPGHGPQPVPDRETDFVALTSTRF